jgi:hypothetical protein
MRLSVTIAAAAFLALTASAGFAETPPAPLVKGIMMVTVVQTRRDRVGDKYSYVADTQTHTIHDGVARDDSDRETFDIEILKVGPSGMTLRYTQTKSEVLSAPNIARTQRFSSVFDGMPIDFETNLSGSPTGLVDMAGVKAKMLAGIARVDPVVAERMKPDLEARSSREVAEQIIGDKLTTLAAMQYRGAFPFGHEDMPAETQTDADGTVVTVHKTSDVLPAEGACRVTIRRATWTERPGGTAVPQSSLETEATLAQDDGWVISLTEISKITVPGAERTKTVKIVRRQDAACPH